MMIPFNSSVFFILIFLLHSHISFFSGGCLSSLFSFLSLSLLFSSLLFLSLESRVLASTGYE
ncbi:hypothetical protein GGR50DRAFT_666028 [Xylaria sp. CBS 124048]|nr:hypothetical protein GGR50DRAFT_666028 [Xylaria sp. CBS 124048]